MKQFSKLKISLEGELRGLGYHRALRGLHFASQYHTGVRKDGVTPELQHQVEIMLDILTLKDLRYREETLFVGACHDVMEDFNVSKVEFANEFRTFHDASHLTDLVYGISKVYMGVAKDKQVVLRDIFYSPILSVAKGVDRKHNHSTMANAFTLEKMLSYLNETKTDILPGLKHARKYFPDQAPAYYNIEQQLHRDIYTIEHLIRRFVPPSNTIIQ